MIRKPRFGKIEKEYEDHQLWYRKEQKQAIINRKKVVGQVVKRLASNDEDEESNVPIPEELLQQMRTGYYRNLRKARKSSSS